jgi:putative addiction module component (TIGR02574 family)
MNTAIVAETLKYDISERILIVEDIWDSIAQVPKALQITETQKKELARRLEQYHKNPDSGTPWKIIKERIVSKQK